jgi:hypothetical protein
MLEQELQVAPGEDVFASLEIPFFDHKENTTESPVVLRGTAAGAQHRVSDCLAGQAIFHGDFVRVIALRIVRSCRRQAMIATFLGRPRLTRR